MPLSTLCQRCGLCCDGSLFNVVPVKPAEVPVLRRRALEVVERDDGSHVLRQRCAALDGTRCRIYADRPESCQRYRCLLFSALAEKEVSLDEALEVVNQAHALIAALGAQLAAGEEETATSVLQRARREAQAQGAALPAAIREARQRAEDFLDRRFRGAQGR